MPNCPKCECKPDGAAQHQPCTSEPQTIEDYIAAQSADVQPRLRELYAILKGVLPDATERLSWKMPTFWKGQNIIHFAAFRHHIGLYPGGRATTVFAEQLTEFQTSKGSIRLPHNRPLPVALITEIAQWCGKENVK